MKLLREQTRLLATVAVVISCLTVAPAAADHGGTSSGSGSDATTNTSTTSPEGSGEGSQPSGRPVNAGTSDSKTTTTEEHTGDTSGTDNGESEGLQARANLLLSDKRQGGHEHSAADRQKSCQELQTQINNKVSRLSTKAQQYLTNFNTIFTQVQAYQTSHQLAVSNYDTLVAETTAKQAAATAAVTSLKNVSVNIDCSATDPAGSVATVETAASDARTALQAYRSSLKALIQALLAAKNTTSSTTTSTTGGNQ